MRFEAANGNMPDFILSAEKVEELVGRLESGKATVPEQLEAAYAIRYYRGAALRTERGIHAVVKEWEASGGAH